MEKLIDHIVWHAPNESRKKQFRRVRVRSTQPRAMIIAVFDYAYVFRAAGMRGRMSDMARA